MEPAAPSFDIDYAVAELSQRRSELDREPRPPPLICPRPRLRLSFPLHRNRILPS